MALHIVHQTAELLLQGRDDRVHVPHEFCQVLLLLLHTRDRRLGSPQVINATVIAINTPIHALHDILHVCHIRVGRGLHVLKMMHLILQDHGPCLELVPQLRQLVPVQIHALHTEPAEICVLVFVSGKHVAQILEGALDGAMVSTLHCLKRLTKTVDLNLLQAKSISNLLLMLVPLLVPARQFHTEILNHAVQALCTRAKLFKLLKFILSGVDVSIHLLDPPLENALLPDARLDELQDVLPKPRLNFCSLQQEGCHGRCARLRL
mmetsp:Transcript_147152/g.256858  ORF Transcript_147152/g.256858 Transcript_147152/m.256858 type:complete len:264 (+) Transcript_147152:978-1769(+)